MKWFKGNIKSTIVVPEKLVVESKINEAQEAIKALEAELLDATSETSKLVSTLENEKKERKTPFKLYAVCPCGYRQAQSGYQNSPELSLVYVCPDCGRDCGEMTERSQRTVVNITDKAWEKHQKNEVVYTYECEFVRYEDSELFKPRTIKSRNLRRKKQ